MNYDELLVLDPEGGVSAVDAVYDELGGGVVGPSAAAVEPAGELITPLMIGRIVRTGRPIQPLLRFVHWRAAFWRSRSWTATLSRTAAVTASCAALSSPAPGCEV